MSVNFPIVCGEGGRGGGVEIWTLTFLKLIDFPKSSDTKRSSLKHIIRLKSKTKNFKCSKRKKSHLQGNPHKTINRFLSRNLTGQ